MSRPGLTPSSYTPVFGVPSLSGITTPRAPAAGLSRGGIGSIGGDATGAPSLESAMKYINELSAQLRPETAGTEPYIAFSPSRKELFVNGFTFAENDAARALESEQYLGQSPVRPEAGDWQQLPTNIYSEYLQSIKDPTAGERFAKSFSSGVGSLQQLWGAALMLATDGGMGEELYQAGTARMERLAPYAKKFSEIKNLDDAGDFMVSLIGSQVPQFLEGITTALIGAGVGAAIGSTGTPAGTAAGGVGGAVLGLTAKGAVKKQLTDIARKKFLKQAVTPAEEALWKQQSGRVGTAIQLAARKKAAGEVLTPDEQKLLRQGAAVTGALTLSTLESYGIGAGDIYSEMMEKGVADQPGARATAALYAAPYAALGAAPEFLAALAFLRPSARTGVRAAAGRFGTGLAVGAGAEGVSEASQEALIMQAAGDLGAQYTPRERTERLLESFAAGAALGGVLGGPVNLLRRPERPAGITPPAEPAPTEPTEPPAPTEPAQLGYEQPLMLGYEPTEARRAAEGEVIVPPAPPPGPPRPPEGPTLADIGDVPEPPAPESILGIRAGLPPSWQRANAPEVPLEAQFQGGVPQQEEFISAPPVVPGQEETFFQDEDLGRGRTRGTRQEEAAAEAAAEPTAVSPIGGTTLRQGSLFTGTGEPTVQAAIGASFGTEKTLNKPQQQALRKLLSIGKPITKNGAPLFGQAEATKLISADGVVLQPNDFNIRGLVNDSTGSVIEVSFPDTKVKVAYDEGRWGSPQQFAKAIGFDFGLLDTGTFVRRNKDGNVSAAQPIVDYVAPPPPIDMTARTERRAKSSLKKGGAAARKAAGTAAGTKPKKTIKKKGDSDDAVQKQESASMDVREQAGDGGGVRDEDRAGDKPPGEGEAQTTEETKPVREAVNISEMSTVDLADEIAGMTPAKRASKDAEKQIAMIMELKRRVDAIDANNDPGYENAVEVLLALDGNADTKRLHDAAKKRLEQEGPASRFSVADGAPVSERSAAIRKKHQEKIKGVVDRILAKLSPKARKNMRVIHVQDLYDLQQNETAIYLALMASRSQQGDFGSAVPAGVYLRNPDGSVFVIMFSQSIRNEAHATLVFLEELVGHTGFRAILGSELDPLMEALYDESPAIASAAEEYARKNKGVGKAEAVEEVLAKEVAREIGVELGVLSPSATPSYVSPNIISRLINEIKKLLNKLFGKQLVGFMDNEDVRVLFAKSKQWAREGKAEQFTASVNLTGVDRNRLVPVFYDRLVERARSSKMESATAQGWMSELRKATPTKEELFISGIEDWFSTQGKDRYSKQEVVDFLSQGGVQTSELVLQNKADLSNLEIKAINKLDALLKQVKDKKSELANLAKAPNTKETNDAITKARTELEEVQKEVAALDMAYPGLRSVRYADHTLMGGTRYTELLITLPRNPLAKDTPTIETLRENIKSVFGEGALGNKYVEKIIKRFKAMPLFNPAVDWVTGKPAFFDATHYKNYPNILAHTRFKTRQVDTPDGQLRLITIEEIQSFWLQLIQREGFFSETTLEDLTKQAIRIAAEVKALRDTMSVQQLSKDQIQAQLDALDPRYLSTGVIRNDSAKDRILELDTELSSINRSLTELYELEDQAYKKLTTPPQNAPLKQSSAWASLLLKRMIRYAAEQGKRTNGISFFAGNVQNGLVYPVHKANSIQLQTDGDGRQYLTVNLSDGTGKRNIYFTDYLNLAQAIGKENAKTHKAQLDAGEVVTGDFTVNTVAGTPFYNEVVKNTANKIAKEFGTELKETEVKVIDAAGDLATVTMYYLQLNDKMREVALYKGFSRYSVAPDTGRQAAPVSRFSVAPGDGPKAADRLTNEERAVLGNTIAADAYEKMANGETNAKIAADLDISVEDVRRLLNEARTKLREYGVTARTKRSERKKLTKRGRAITALSTPKPDGSYPTVAEVAKAMDLQEDTVRAAMNKERQEYLDKGMKLPAWLTKPTAKGKTVVFDYGRAATPLYNPQRPMPRELASALEWFEDFKVDASQVKRDVLNALKTMNFSSRSNAGYREAYRILTDMKNTISQLRAKYTARLEDTLSNTDQKVRREVSRMLQFTTQAKMVGLTDRELRKLPKLFRVEGNNIIVDPEVFKQLSRMGRFTIAEFRKGITRTQEVPFVTENGQIDVQTVTIKFPAMPDLTEDSLTWKLYQQVRDTMDEAAIDRARADYAAAFGVRENTFETIRDLTNKPLTDANKKLIDLVNTRYREIIKENATQDPTGKLVYRLKSTEDASKLMADFNRVLIAKSEDKERLDAFASHFPEAARAKVIEQIKDLRNGMTFSEANKYDVQRVVADLAALELGKEDGELYAKRSIAGGYIPIGRTGRWQTRIRAVDPKTGQVYGMMDSFRSQLPYFQHEDRSAAERLAKDINALFPQDKATMKIPVFDTKTKEYVVKEVRLEAVADAARETPSVDPGINVNEFMRMITRFGVTLTPQERERIIIGMTEQNARARTNLQRQNVEGQDPDSVPYIAQHLETLANITGRRTHQHRTDKLLDEKNAQSQRLWNGDPTRLAALEKRYDDLAADPMTPTEVLKQVEREYNQYAFEMRRTQEEGGAGVFKDRFVRDLSFLEEQKALEYTDFASDGFGQSLRTWTAVAQLGGSFATAALNILSVPLNVLPALASYNIENNFGGGFGMGRSAAALSAAIKDVGGMNRYRPDYYKGLLKNKDALAKSGLTRDEAEFLAREIEFGNLQAALANALTASAKGRFGRSPRIQKFIDVYMSAFTYSEQAARRASALAAYRLERDRQLDAGVDRGVAINAAERFAIDLTDFSLGNYNMYNRPGGFRGGLRDFIFMYKMYPITVIQLLSALSTPGKIAMLLPLVLFSGLKGLPFAEDLTDLIDTILQKLLKVPVGSSEKWAADQLNNIAPGLTPVLMRGVVDQMIPGTVSSRVGLGNLIPGTGIALPGSNQFREILDFLGPAAAFVEGTAVTAGATLGAGASLLGAGGAEPSVSGILRGSPVTMARAVGDVMEYYQTGAIVDSKGYVSSYDLNPLTYGFRVLGFYPGAATRENDVVRVTKRQADYLREISTGFRRSYVKAALRNDREGMQRVTERVRDWNEAARGTGLEIPNFAINARRAVQEARKESAERYISSAPKSLRIGAQEAQETFGAE